MHYVVGFYIFRYFVFLYNSTAVGRKKGNRNTEENAQSMTLAVYVTIRIKKAMGSYRFRNVWFEMFEIWFNYDVHFEYHMFLTIVEKK